MEFQCLARTSSNYYSVAGFVSPCVCQREVDARCLPPFLSFLCVSSMVMYSGVYVAGEGQRSMSGVFLPH